jgi:hypothetical protein
MGHLVTDLVSWTLLLEYFYNMMIGACRPHPAGGTAAPDFSGTAFPPDGAIAMASRRTVTLGQASRAKPPGRVPKEKGHPERLMPTGD